MNFRIRTLRDALIRTINESEIPVEVKRLILSEILGELTKLSDKFVAEEIARINEEAKKDGNISENDVD